jgi:KinB signaling pathway activation protein
MTPQISKLLRLFLMLWAVAAFLSGLVHLSVPMFMSSGTSWPYAYGWQREIAFFDIALTAYIVLQLRSGSHFELVKLVYFLSGLSFFLGFNHLLSAFYGGWAYVHVAACIGNAVAVSVAAFIFIKSR